VIRAVYDEMLIYVRLIILCLKQTWTFFFEESSMSGIENLSIHFYGVQGSVSIFPANVERMETQALFGINLLAQVFEDMHNCAGADNKLNSSVEDIIGGPINKEAWIQNLSASSMSIAKGLTACQAQHIISQEPVFIPIASLGTRMPDISV
jgi:hypothetical protein